MNPNIEEGLPEGKYRLEVYECVKSVIGRDLSVAEHKHLSHVLKVYANTAREKQIVITTQPPTVHRWICDNCGSEVDMGKNIPGSMKTKTMKLRSKKNKAALDEKARS